LAVRRGKTPSGLHCKACVPAKEAAAAAWSASTEQALRKRVAELEQEARAMQTRIEDMARKMARFMDAMAPRR
jgi:prefoldin subunit 5